MFFEPHYICQHLSIFGVVFFLPLLSSVFKILNFLYVTVEWSNYNDLEFLNVSNYFRHINKVYTASKKKKLYTGIFFFFFN